MTGIIFTFIAAIGPEGDMPASSKTQLELVWYSWLEPRPSLSDKITNCTTVQCCISVYEKDIGYSVKLYHKRFS